MVPAAYIQPGIKLHGLLVPGVVVGFSHIPCQLGLEIHARADTVRHHGDKVEAIVAAADRRGNLDALLHQGLEIHALEKPECENLDTDCDRNKKAQQIKEGVITTRALLERDLIARMGPP